MERVTVEYHRVQRILTQQEQSCGSCGEELDASTDVVLFQIVRPHRQLVEETQQWVIHFAKELADDGDFDSYPYFFHVDCWAETYELLKELVEGTEPYVIGDHICLCEFCNSHIAEGDLMGVAHEGQFKLSERQPNGHDAIDIILNPENPIYACLSCINELNINVIEGLWEEDGTVATTVRDGEERWESARTT